MVAYGAGTLNPGQALTVAAHIERCPRCAGRNLLGADIGAALIEAQTPAPLPADSLAGCWERIAAGAPPVPAADATAASAPGELPRALEPYLPHGLDALSWGFLTPLIRQYPLAALSGERGWVRLFKFMPGAVVPTHSHQESEMTLVLEGAYHDEFGHFRCGDLADLEADCRHGPVVDGDEPCIAVIATEGRVRFGDPLHRLGANLIGI